MNALYPEDRVEVHAHWSSFRGMCGVVKSTNPLMVLIDGDRAPMRFGEGEVRRLPSAELSTPNLSGAE